MGWSLPGAAGVTTTAAGAVPARQRAADAVSNAIFSRDCVHDCVNNTVRGTMKPAVFMLKWKFNRVTSGGCWGCSTCCLQEHTRAHSSEPGHEIPAPSHLRVGGGLPPAPGAHVEPEPWVYAAPPSTVIRWGWTGSRGHFPDPFCRTEVPCHCYQHGAPAGWGTGCSEPVPSLPLVLLGSPHL